MPAIGVSWTKSPQPPLRPLVPRSVSGDTLARTARTEAKILQFRAREAEGLVLQNVAPRCALSAKSRCGSGQVPPVRVTAITIPGPVRVGAGVAIAPVEWAVRRAAEPLAKRADVVAAGVSAVFVPAA